MKAHIVSVFLFLSALVLPAQPTQVPAGQQNPDPATPLTAHSPASDPAQVPTFTLNTVPIGPDGPDRYILTQTLTPSPDSGSVSYRHRFGFELALDGIAFNGKNFLTVENATRPVFSPDSQTLAFLIREGGNRWKLFYKGELTKGFEPVTSVRFSPDGKRLIYLARDEKKRFVMEGGRAHPYADDIDWDRLVLTSDSSVMAYPAIVDGTARMVINGDPGPAWDRIVTAPITMKHAPNIYYVATKYGRYYVVDRHTAGSDPGFVLIDHPPVVSDDGQTFAYWARGDDLYWRVYRNHKPVRGYDTERPGQLVLSADGQTLVAVLKKGDAWHVVRNGQTGPAFTAIGQGSLTLSPDGKRLAYAVRKQQGWAVILDDQELPTSVQLAANSLRFSPDSQRFTYTSLSQGQWSVVTDGVAGPGFSQIDTQSLAFSPDSQHLAYFASNMGWPVVVLDGQVLGEYDQAEQLTYSPTSEHLVYVATQDQQTQLYVNGQPTGETFEELVPAARIHFKSDMICQTVAIRREQPSPDAPHGSYTGPTMCAFELDLTPPLPAPGNDHDGTPPPAEPEDLGPAVPDPSFVDVPTP